MVVKCIYIIFYLFFRFHDIPSEIIGSAKYSWNPCNAFNEGTTCINVTVIISIYKGVNINEKREVRSINHHFTSF